MPPETDSGREGHLKKQNEANANAPEKMNNNHWGKVFNIPASLDLSAWPAQ